MTLVIPVEDVKLTKRERDHAECIYEACIAEAVREDELLTEGELLECIVSKFVISWEDVFNAERDSYEQVLMANKKAYSAFNYANQVLGANGGVHTLLSTLSMKPPSIAFMEKLASALDQYVVMLTLKPITIQHQPIGLML